MEVLTDLIVLESEKPSIEIIPVSEDSFMNWFTDAPDIDRTWVTVNQFKGKPGQMLVLPNEDGTIYGVLVGVKTWPFEGDMSPWELAGFASKLPAGRYHFTSAMERRHQAAAATGWALEQYVFDRYKDAGDEGARYLCLPVGSDLALVHATIEATRLVRDLINTPAEHMGPPELEAAARDLADGFGAGVTAVIGDDLLEQNFPTIHLVGRAAEKAPRLIDLTWGDADAPKITLVGKGVCFDTGGLHLKTGSYMNLMKKDMGGAAHVLGLAHLIMAADLPVRLRVLIPAVENNVSGSSMRPGDVVTTRAGISVEIGNTDAEGRLVLCDALSLASEEEPDILMDFATLTGAARVALGPDLPATFTADDDLYAAVESAGKRLDDPVWRLPLWKPYLEDMKSSIADTNNISDGAFAGAITAALYLERFTEGAKSWMHLDVFGWKPKPGPGRAKGGHAQGIFAAFDAISAKFPSE